MKFKHRSWSARPARDTILIAAVPVISLLVGALINSTVVAGPYDWLGLLRVCIALFEEEGFWCIALFVWAMGTINASDGYQWAHFVQHRPHILAWFLATLALILASNIIAVHLPIGSKLDMIAFAILIPGSLITDIVRNKGTPYAEASIIRSVLIGMAIFVGYTFVSYCHTTLKAALFVLSEPQDSILTRLDAALLGTDHLTQLASWRRNHAGYVLWLDIVYFGLLQQICWAALFFHGTRDAAAGKRYVLAIYLIYSVGSITYYLIPSMGPLFYSPIAFEDIKTTTHATWQLSQFLVKNTGFVRAGVSHTIAPYGYIAAFPSVHVGVAVIMLMAMRPSRSMAILNVAMLILCASATYVLGWHYASDIVAGGVLGVAVWALATSLLGNVPPEYMPRQQT